MHAQAVTNILLALLGVTFPAATFFYASRSNRIQLRAEATKAAIEEKGVDAQAYEQAAKLYQDLIQSLRTQVDRLDASNRTLESEVSTLRESNAALVDEVNRLRMEVAMLKRGKTE